MATLKIGSHFTIDDERWQVLGHSPNFVSAINSAGKRRRFGREQLAERLRVAFVNLRLSADGEDAEKAKPMWEENPTRLVDRCIVKCGVSREHIERLAIGVGLPIRAVAMELLAQKNGG